ncbi:MAG: hypothetical protein U0U66_04720 [Cytophagaceae bacterium]
MRKYISFIGLLILMSTTTALKENVIQTDIVTAIKENKIESNVKYVYNSTTGINLLLTLKNTTNQTQIIVIKRGTSFLPDNSGEQTLVTPKEYIVTIEKATTKNITVPGYCTESNDYASSDISTFTIINDERKPLLELIEFLKTTTVSERGIIQQSIWCITDGNDVANINGIDALNAKKIREYVCSKTGQKDTWYSTARQPVITEDRRIINTANKITGQIQIESSKPMELIGEVKDNLGNVLWEFPHPMKFPAGSITFDFKLEVGGWKNGEYSVVYSSEGKELLNKKFKI